MKLLVSAVVRREFTTGGVSGAHHGVDLRRHKTVPNTGKEYFR
jgi:hypothetical protein